MLVKPHWTALSVSRKMEGAHTLGPSNLLTSAASALEKLLQVSDRDKDTAALRTVKKQN